MANLTVRYLGLPYGNNVRVQAACCARSVSRTGINPRRTFYYLGQRYIFRLNQLQSVPEDLANLLIDTEVYTENGIEKHGFEIVT